MTEVQQLPRFVVGRGFDDLSKAAQHALKARVLDSPGCAIGALGAEPMEMLRTHTDDFGGSEYCTLIGADARVPPGRAALYNGALVRYLDFNDGYLAPGETCYPSDNLAPVLAAAKRQTNTQAAARLLRNRMPTYWVHDCRNSLPRWHVQRGKSS